MWREQEPGVGPGSNPKALCAYRKVGGAYLSVTHFYRDVRLALSAGWDMKYLPPRLYIVRGHALLVPREGFFDIPASCAQHYSTWSQPADLYSSPDNAT